MDTSLQIRGALYAIAAGLLFCCLSWPVIADEPPEKEQEAFTWNEDWDAAFAEAKKNEKPLLAYFTSKSCGACKYMEQNTFADPVIRERLERGWVVVRIYTNYTNKTGTYKGKTKTYAELARMMRVVGVPSFVFFDRDGKPVQKATGARDSDEFGPMLDYMRDEAYKKNIPFDEYRKSR